MAILMLLPLVVSCSEKETEQEDESAVTTEEEEVMQMSDKLRWVSFYGEEISLRSKILIESIYTTKDVTGLYKGVESATLTKIENLFNGIVALDWFLNKSTFCDV